MPGKAALGNVRNLAPINPLSQITSDKYATSLVTIPHSAFKYALCSFLLYYYLCVAEVTFVEVVEKYSKTEMCPGPNDSPQPI